MILWPFCLLDALNLFGTHFHLWLLKILKKFLLEGCFYMNVGGGEGFNQSSQISFFLGFLDASEKYLGEEPPPMVQHPQNPLEKK